MSRDLLTLFLVSLSFGFLSLTAQTFTRITEGPMVNGGGNSTGSSWIDFNNDGFIDLFVANGNISAENNALFRNNQMGAFSALLNIPMVTDNTPSIGATWGDYDNDGDVDLFVANRENINNLFYENNGDGSFLTLSNIPPVSDGGNSNISSWLDVENDGDLDLFVLNFNQANFLYLNDGDGNFSRVSSDILVTDITPSISAAWGDYDNDSDLDLFVANGGNQNNILYINQGNVTFTKSTFSDGLSSLGASWGDFDNDGDLDLFVANFLDANNRLYRNSGAPDYILTPLDAGSVSGDSGFTVGSGWGDFDNDGDIDLIAGNANGQNAFLYTNNGDTTFTKISSGDIVENGGSTFSVSMGDIDRDGDLDVYMSNINNENNFLYRNEQSGSNWVCIKGIGINANRSAVGCRFYLKSTIANTPVWQMREIVSQHGYNSQNSYWQHFGIGDALTVDTLLVRWPGGETDTISDLSANQYYTVTENQGVLGLAGGKLAIPRDFTLEQNFPNPFNPETTVRYHLNRRSYRVITIYDIRGKVIKTVPGNTLPAGSYTFRWNGRNDAGTPAASGSYFLHIRTENSQRTIRMLLVR